MAYNPEIFSVLSQSWVGHIGGWEVSYAPYFLQDKDICSVLVVLMLKGMY